MLKRDEKVCSEMFVSKYLGIMNLMPNFMEAIKFRHLTCSSLVAIQMDTKTNINLVMLWTAAARRLLHGTTWR